jgi:hypothetical protein
MTRKQIFPQMIVVAGVAAVLGLGGAAQGQVPAGQVPAGEASPAYAVDGLVLGSKVKADSAAYREFKCSPSEQFDGFTWCQKSRRENQARGSFDATYSLLHAKDGTIVYLSRYQQPSFFDAKEAGREIQNYAQRFGGTPKITRIPRRSGNIDALLATWGGVELEPLDDESMKTVAAGRSPKKGFMVDFLGDFAKSAREGLPVYRITGGPGFVWSDSFDPKGRGTMRFVAVDASAMEPAAVVSAPPPAPVPVATQPAAPIALAAQPPVAKADEPKAESKAESKIQETPPQAETEAAPAPTPSPRIDPDTTVARLQVDLAAAVKAKTEAVVALATAEKVAAQARSEAEIARRELQAARGEANAASKEIDRLRAGAGPHVSYVKEIIIGGIFALAVLFLLIRLVSRMQAVREAAVDADADADLRTPQDAVDGAIDAPSATAPTEAATPFDEDDVVKKLAMTLGVEDPIPPPEAVRGPEHEDASLPEASGENDSREHDAPVLASAPESVPAADEVPELEAPAVDAASGPPEKAPTA